MDYGIQVGDLSEKVRREVAVIVGSPATLDERAWDAISAVSAIGGHIEFSGLVDKTDPDNPVIYAEGDLPVTIPCGSVVFAVVLYYNDDPYATHDLTCMVEFLDPDGVSIGQATVTESVGVGGHKTLSTLGITLDKAGTYNIHSVLSG